jgi:3-methylfumaryl-CoA hydratase
MQVTLDRPATLAEGDPLPPMWHYVYFNPEVRASDLKQDGHEALGRFLPPVALPRRMWAGGEIEIAAPLRIGEEVKRTSTIRDVQSKHGRSGDLCFVTVEHAFSVAGEARFTEVQNIVYRGAAAGGGGAPVPCGRAERRRAVHPDPVLLFRYSALIFFGHRIHYDADYTRDVEGYPGLVVHGPLTATLLIGFGCEAHDTPLRRIALRAQAPLFCGAPFALEAADLGATTEVWARRPDGGRAMTVTLEFADAAP